MTFGSEPQSASDIALKKLIDGPKLPLDKSPVLQAVFDRFASACADSMREFCTVPCTFMLNGMNIGNSWDLLDAYEAGFGAVFRSPEWDARIVIGCDRRFAVALVEPMFGADGSENPSDGDRPLTGLEGRVVREVLVCAAKALQRELMPICYTEFVFERTESALNFSTIGVRDETAIMAQLVIQVLDGGGRLFVLIPSGALTPFRQRLESEYSSEPSRSDPIWSHQLSQQVGFARVNLQAVLDGPQITLDALTHLRPGQIITLLSSPKSPIRLEVEDEGLFTADLAKSKGYFTVSINRRIDEGEQLWGHIISAMDAQ